MEDKTSSSKQGVFIRGIDRVVYNRIIEVARSMGKTIGEVTNEAYKLFIVTVEGAKEASKALIEEVKGVEVISNIDELEVTGKELISFNKRIVFKGIKKLAFRDIDEDVFDKYVEKIVSINELIIPKDLQKLHILAKCSLVGKIVQQ